MYTTKDALKFAEDKKLESWIDDFLRNEGDNVPLADGLQMSKRYYIGPVTVNLDMFDRISGPEDHMEFRVTEESFEMNILNIQARLKNGWDMPPFLVQYADDKFVLSDGNHRHEALKRSGYIVYSAIFWCSTNEEYEELKKILAYN